MLRLESAVSREEEISWGLGITSSLGIGDWFLLMVSSINSLA